MNDISDYVKIENELKHFNSIDLKISDLKSLYNYLVSIKESYSDIEKKNLEKDLDKILIEIKKLKSKKESILGSLNILSKLEKQIITLTYFENMQAWAISKIIKRDESSYRRNRIKAINKIVEFILGEEGLIRTSRKMLHINTKQETIDILLNYCKITNRTRSDVISEFINNLKDRKT